MLTRILLALLASSCQSTGPWHHQTIQNGNLDHDLAKLSYPPSNPHKGLELELVRHGSDLRGYLNAHTFSFPEHAEVTINTETFVVDRLEGGQRLRLTEPCLNSILNHLKHQNNVTITIGHFYQEISAQTFRHHYQDLMRQPSRFTPAEWISFEVY